MTPKKKTTPPRRTRTLRTVRLQAERELQDIAQRLQNAIEQLYAAGLENQATRMLVAQAVVQQTERELEEGVAATVLLRRPRVIPQAIRLRRLG